MVKYCVLLIMCLFLSSCGDSHARHQLLSHSLDNMLYVPGGTYNMGMGDGTPTTVTSFYIDKYNTSYGEYDLYTAATWKKKTDSDDLTLSRGKNYPADELTWYQAHDYCAYLAKKTGLPFSLSTEAQWEYVARNNGKKHWDFPTNNGKLQPGINFPSDQQIMTHPGTDNDMAETFPVNHMPCTPQGVCGLTGSVNEWTRSYKGKEKMIRGASILGDYEFQNTYGSAAIAPNKKWAGFRCVINTDMPMAQMKAILAKNIK